MADPGNFTRVAAFSRFANDLIVWFDADPAEWRLMNVPMALDDHWRRSADMTEFYRDHVHGQFPVRRLQVPEFVPDIRP